MLTRLEIKNYAIIEALDLHPDKGLTIVTGETGAGKSILLGALGLIMGDRADSKVLYHQDEKCVVEATYDISSYDLKPLFEKHDIDYEKETTIRRIIQPSGKSRAFINDVPTTLSVLKELSENLVDMHQQFDMLDIHKVSFQTQTIDALADNLALMEDYRKQYTAYRTKLKKLSALQEQEKENRKEMDFLAYQLEEFGTAELMPGELHEKEQLLKKVSSAEEIKQATYRIFYQLEDAEVNIADQIKELLQELSSFTDTDDEISALYSRLSSAYEELVDIAKESASKSEEVEYDEEQISILSDRIDLINRLMNKHDIQDYEALLDVEKSLVDKMSSFTDVSNEINKLEKELKEEEASLRSIATSLSERRKKTAPKFEKEIHDMLVPLSMEHAYIKVDIQPTEDLAPSGMDDITFLFSPNKGSDFKKLKDIASGGEISRLTLCLKALVADAITLPTLIFDEIDTGVSGEVAGRMGDILHKLASKHQVISITHSPQIASKADTHFFVYKEDKAERTVTGIRSLDDKERIYEIAKMLSADPPSQAAIANAEELLAISK